MDDTFLATLTLQLLPGLGPGRYWRLLEQFADPLCILQTSARELAPFLPDAARQMLAEYQQKRAASQLGQMLSRHQQWLAAHDDVQVLTFHHPDYPELLRQTYRPPILLYVRGDITCLSLPQIAIVGSRKPTAGGEDNAYQFARSLAASGFAITSGLALGVDAAAHRGALAAKGKTLAVFGTGIDNIYPARHQGLAEEILAEGGALISEFPLFTRSHASHFPQRNRLISGLSCGTLVVEAAVQSGSLITARLALQQNREVFAIPGSIHNPLARGCHSLIKQGATLVETAGDIMEHLAGMLAFSKASLPQAGGLASEALRQLDSEPAEINSTPTLLPREDEILLAAIAYDPVSFDDLLVRTGIPAGQASARLLELELRGFISLTSSGYLRCAPS